MRPDGVVLEAPTSTIFWVSPEGGLRTPSIGSGILESITRAHIIKALHVEEGEFGLDDLLGTHEAFLASTVREVQPVSAIDDFSLEIPGPGRTRRPRRSRHPQARSARRGLGCTAVDLDLTDEQRLISETARDFTDNEIIPRARDNDRESRFDIELARRLGDMGYLGSTVDEEYGGQALSYVNYGLIVEQIGRGDSSARTVVSVQTSLVCGSIERWGTEEQKKQWLPRLCAGEAFGCFGLTEPDAGSDPSSMRTRAVKIDGGWRITGQKMWISLGNVAEVALIFAQTNPEERHRGIACFLVPTESEGFSSQEIHGKLGLRASDTASLGLDDVEVSDDALLGEVGDGFKIAMTALEAGRYSVAAGCVGICEGCVTASVDYAKDRVQFGVPIASFQLVQEMIAEMILRRTRRSCSSDVPGSSRTRASRTPPKPRSPSSTPRRPPSSAPTWRSRSTAAPATSTTTPSSGTCATPG